MFFFQNSLKQIKLAKHTFKTLKKSDIFYKEIFLQLTFQKSNDGISCSVVKFQEIKERELKRVIEARQKRYVKKHFTTI